MKRPTWKLLITIVAIALMAMILMWLKMKKSLTDAEEQLARQTDKALFWQSKSGKYLADIAVLQGAVSNAKVKSIAKEAIVPARRIKNIGNITTISKQTIIATEEQDTLIWRPKPSDVYVVTGGGFDNYPVIPAVSDITPIHDPQHTRIDTGRIFRYTDEWIDIEARSGVLGLEIDYQVRDSISLIEYKQSGKRRYRAISHAPNTRITGLENISLENKSHFVFGPFVGAAIDANTLKVAPVIGIGVGFTLFKI